MKKNYFLLTFFLMCVMGMQVSATNVLVDLSELDRADNTADLRQQGWSVAGIMNEINMARYLVLEVEGEGDNGDGFGGIYFIFQGKDGGDPPTVEVGMGASWIERLLNGGWTSFPREDGKTVSIAIDINNVLEGEYNDFIRCTGWARIIIGYYGSSTAFEGLGLTNAYLVDNIEKPADAVDFATGYGFIFEGSVGGEVQPKEKENLPIGNDSDLNAGWGGSSYEAATKTITFTSDWTGRGWGWWTKDWSTYIQVVVEIEPTDATTKLVVEYADGSENDPEVYAQAGETLLVVNLDPAKKNAIKQVYLQRETAGGIVLVEAYFTTKSVTTNISDVANSSSVAYYVGNTLFLNGFGDVQIYNINGSTLLTKQNVSSVDLSALGKGVYIAKTIVNGQAQVVKILK